MRIPILAALALTAASSLQAQSVADLSTVTPVGGTWSWVQTADGSEASFAGADTKPQVTIHCTRVTRRITISKASSAPAAVLGIWTSSQVKNLPASFNAATGKVSAVVAAFDPLLDALSTSRGRIGFAMPGSVPLVLPPWAEIARVVEDCRV